MTAAQEEDQKDEKPPILAAVLCLLPSLLYFHADAPLLPSVVLYLNLWVLALYDFKSYRLPNLLTATLVLTGLMFVLITPGVSVKAHLIGGLVGVLFLPVVNFGYRVLRGRDGIGLGDAKLLAGIGVWLGWFALPPVLLVGSIFGLVYGLVAGVGRDGALMTSKIPFGPFLCLGAWLVWLFL